MTQRRRLPRTSVGKRRPDPRLAASDEPIAAHVALRGCERRIVESAGRGHKTMHPMTQQGEIMGVQALLALSKNGKAGDLSPIVRESGHVAVP